jgi:hypothetical protein
VATTIDAATVMVSAGVAANLTWKHTVGKGSFRRIDVRVQCFGTPPTGGKITCTYAGMAMTLLGYNSNGSLSVWAFYLFAPPQGTKDILVQVGTSCSLVAEAISYSNADQSTPGTPVYASANSTTPSVTVSSTAGDLVSDAVIMAWLTGETLTATGGQTEKGKSQNGDIWGASSIKAGAASVTLSWTNSQTVVWISMAWNVKAATLPAAATGVTWHVIVDWDGDGVMETDEGARMIDFSSMRGRKIGVQYTDREATGIANAEVGTATLTLTNYDYRFDPYNTSSPLYPYVKPGAFVQVQVVDNTTLVVEDVITGRVKNIVPVAGQEQVYLEIADGAQDLTLDKANVYAVNVATLVPALMAALLTGANYPALWGSAIDLAVVCTLNLPYWFTASGQDFLDALRNLANVDMGVFFVDKHGVAEYCSSALQQSSLATWTEDQLLKEILLPNPWENFRDKISVKSYGYTLAASLTDVWTYGEVPLVKAGTWLTVWTDNGPCKNLQAPVATTDYLMNSAADGSGTNRTSSFTVTANPLYGMRSRLTISAGAYDGYVTLLKIRGKVISASRAATYVSQPDSNVHNLTIDNPLMQSYTQALKMQTFYQSFFGGGDGFPVVQMENRPTLQYAQDLFDAVTLQVSDKNINALYRIGYIAHKWGSPNGQVVQSTFGLEPAGTFYHV